MNVQDWLLTNKEVDRATRSDHSFRPADETFVYPAWDAIRRAQHMKDLEGVIGWLRSEAMRQPSAFTADFLRVKASEIETALNHLVTKV